MKVVVYDGIKANEKNHPWISVEMKGEGSASWAGIKKSEVTLTLTTDQAISSTCLGKKSAKTVFLHWENEKGRGGGNRWTD